MRTPILALSSPNLLSTYKVGCVPYSWTAKLFEKCRLLIAKSCRTGKHGYVRRRPLLLVGESTKLFLIFVDQYHKKKKCAICWTNLQIYVNFTKSSQLSPSILCHIQHCSYLPNWRQYLFLAFCKILWVSFLLRLAARTIPAFELIHFFSVDRCRNLCSNITLLLY